MFFKQIRRNARRSRKDNGLFFGSLVIAIISFYILLSLNDQDVMMFLKTIESDAVSKLMLLIPIVYIVSLFFVFFLVYFAYRYQLDNRRREFGLYLMLGMKRSKLFLMLMGETIWNSFISMLLGLPLALFLSEAISLATAKLVGLGIIGHSISFSLTAVLVTAVGFALVQVTAMLFLSRRICSREPLELLQSDSAKKQILTSIKKGLMVFGIALILLLCAYVLGVSSLRNFDFITVLLVIILGIAGTFLFYKGAGSFIGYALQRKSGSRAGLTTFTGRQLQENVIHEYKSLSISSLLLLMAIACVSFGMGIAASRSTAEKSTDFSVKGNEAEVTAFLESEENAALIDSYYPIYLGTMNYEEMEVSWDDLIERIKALQQTEQSENIAQILETRTDPYLISETSYNNLLISMGKEPISLSENEAAFYTSMPDSGEFANVFNQALKEGGFVEVGGQIQELLPEIYKDNIVADRSITIYLALIVTDADYERWTIDSQEIYCWNVLLSQDIIKKNGLIQSIQLLADNLNKTELMYESYLGSIGRNLFYTVAASYLTIYLGILFMIIANTMIGLKYLMQQRASEQRYRNLLMLGANTAQLCKCARSQIRMFFFMSLGLAVCSAVFAVWTLFTSIMRLTFEISFVQVITISAAVFLLLMLLEIIYIHIVERTSGREIRKLQVTDEGVDKA